VLPPGEPPVYVVSVDGPLVVGMVEPPPVVVPPVPSVLVPPVSLPPGLLPPGVSPTPGMEPSGPTRDSPCEHAASESDIRDATTRKAFLVERMRYSCVEWVPETLPALSCVVGSAVSEETRGFADRPHDRGACPAAGSTSWKSNP
jgi:hypothetical protein